MKRTISFLLCIVMVLGVFSCASVVASAAEAKNILTASDTGFVNGKITYTVSLASNVKIDGALILFKYDSSVLKVVEGGAVQAKNALGDIAPVINGEYVQGDSEEFESTYSVGYICPESFNTGSTGKKFVYVTFERISYAKTSKSVEISCKELRSDVANIYLEDSDSSKLIENTEISLLDSPVLVSATSGANGVTVKWKAVEGASAYVVYRKTGSGNYSTLETVSATTYLDNTAVSGTKYSYTVRATDGKLKSGYNKTGLVVTYNKVVIANTTTGISLKWSSVYGSTGYRIYRKLPTDTKYTRLTDSKLSKSTVSYSDKTGLVSGKSYIYLVRSYDSEGNFADSVTDAFYYLQAPAVKVVNAYGGVKVSWSKIAGAEKYKVYRKTAKSGWTSLGYTKSLSFVDSKATSGVAYNYTVAAYSGSVKSAYKSSVAVTYCASPAAKLSNTASGIKISWAKITGATQYAVYRKSGNSWKRIATVKSLSYIDKNVKSGNTYTYTVRAYNGKVASGYNNTGWKLKFLSVPKLASAVSYKSGISVKWGKVTGANGYIVYRKTGNGSWSKLATVKGNASVSYLDKSAKKGTTYKYTVRAYYGSYLSYYNTKGLSCKDKY